MGRPLKVPNIPYTSENFRSHMNKKEFAFLPRICPGTHKIFWLRNIFCFYSYCGHVWFLTTHQRVLPTRPWTLIKIGTKKDVLLWKLEE
jgi:hypothetical protein